MKTYKCIVKEDYDEKKNFGNYMFSNDCGIYGRMWIRSKKSHE